MKNTARIFAVSLILIASIALSQDTSSVKPFFEQFKYTVALVETISSKSTPDSLSVDPIGTGFWVQDSSSNSTVLISNKHIFNDFSEIVLSQYSSTGETSALMIVKLKDQSGKKLWVGHPDSLTDIAAIKVKYFSRIGPVRAEIIGIPLDLFGNANEVVEGDEVFILGFPMGIRTTGKSFPMLRSGVLSLKPTEDFLVLSNGGVIGRNVYLLDANILGGSSGSPVFLKPVLSRPFLSPGGFGAVTPPKLIGVVSAYVNDFLPIIKAESSFYAKGNSGITIVHRAEEILSVVKEVLK